MYDMKRQDQIGNQWRLDKLVRKHIGHIFLWFGMLIPRRV
jgi:hypothetical protein